MDKNEYKNNKSLLGFVVDESKVSKEIDNEKENIQDQQHLQDPEVK